MFPLVVSAMKMHKENEDIRRVGVPVLMRLANTDTAWNIIIGTEAVSTVFSAVEKFK